LPIPPPRDLFYAGGMPRFVPSLAVALLILVLAACEDRDRGGLGPRGTALPPPPPGAEPPR
jgi:hypothetical protein